MTILRESLQYEPVELAFGTSGLRGLVTDMTDLECYINTQGFIRFLENFEGLGKNSTIAVAGDLRDSTPRIQGAVIRAITDSGHKAQYCGLIPTPALALWAQNANQAAVMVTGSHIPADRNGIKFYKPSGEVLKSDESNIKQSVADVRSELYELKADDNLFSSDGMLVAYELPEIEPRAEQNFTDRYKNMFDSKFLSGKQVIVYQHSSVGRDLLVDILQYLGAETIPVDRSEKFITIDTENVTQENQDYFRSLAQKYPDAFAIISADGDSDRPFVVDEKGGFHRGDVLGFIVSREIGVDFAAIPISSSDAVDESLEKENISWKHTKIGSPYVIEEMTKSGAKLPVGWEVNGGFLVGADFDYEGKKVERLPTRDSFLPIFIALEAATKRSIKVSGLFSELPARFTQAGLIDNFPNQTSHNIISKFSKGSTGKLLAEKIFNDQYGFDKLKNIDTTDGARLYFNSGDIVHVRPSGNAPQLRVYSVANSQARADEIVSISLGEDGLLRQLEKAVTKIVVS
ncbi:MAG: phosphomannomutase [Patescibacteria group bacterium]